jgi:hypothetical protein
MVAAVRHAMADCDMRDQEGLHTRVTYDVDTWTSGKARDSTCDWSVGAPRYP